MDQITIKQQQILQRQADLIDRYPVLWSQMITEWRQPGFDDQAWLMYSANYLFRTNNIRWAMDPVRLNHRILQAPDFDIAKDLKELSFVLLTHEHSDHLDLDLIHSLRHFPITWIIPNFILQKVVEAAGLSAEQVIVPRPMEPINVHGIRITPFDGLHWAEELDAKTGSPRGVPAIAYLIEFNNKRWLFPGDTRTYDASQLPSYGNVDGMFAHLWLGRGCAAQDESSLLDAFCRFCLDLQSSRIILTHIHEFGRDANEFWSEDHAKTACSRIRAISPDVFVTVALTGERVLLL